MCTTLIFAKKPVIIYTARWEFSTKLRRKFSEIRSSGFNDKHEIPLPLCPAADRRQRPRWALFLQIFCLTRKNGRRVFCRHPLGSDNTANFEVSGALLSPVRPWVAVPNTTVFQTAPRQFPRDRVGLLTSKIGRIQPRVRIPRGRVFSRHPAG